MILPPGQLRRDPPLAETFGRERATGAPLSGLAWLGSSVVTASGDGLIRTFDARLSPVAQHQAHEGAVLAVAAAPDGPGLVTGGDDGRVMRTPADGAPVEVAKPGKWVDHVALSARGDIAWSEGRRAVWQLADGVRHALDHPSTVGGLAFDADGGRLAVAHYNGATLWTLAGAQPTEQKFGWKGSHIGVTFSPNGKFLVTVMQENSLHGWRISDGANMRMSGYPSKPRVLSWSANGLWLASSGAEGGVLWQFKGKDGPMGKTAELLGPRPARVTAVAWHPKSEVLAAGYDDGGLFLLRRADKNALLIRRPKAGGAVAALAWGPAGKQAGEVLAWGTADGIVGSVDIAVATASQR